MNTIDAYIEKHHQFAELLQGMRRLFLDTCLEETIKWGIPTYVYQGKNVAGMAAFKNHCSLWFYQGALLKDKQKKLMNAQEGKTIAQRQWRFLATDPLEEDLLRAYILEAIANEQAGRRIKPQKKALVVPAELTKRLNEEQIAATFDQLSLTNKRSFCAYISEAKKETTKQRRLDKIIPMIRKGQGLHDQYKNC